MTILAPTEITGRVAALLVNPDRSKGLETSPVERLELTWEGIVGNATHVGIARPSGGDVLRQYPRGTEIRNVRQVTIVSVEDLAEIARNMELDEVRPEWLGANMMLTGIPQLSLVPPSSRLIFEGGGALTVDMESAPCRAPGEVIETHFPGKGRSFPQAAVNLRGLNAWVERAATVAVGEAVRLHIPPQRIYVPAVDSAEAAE